MRLPGAWRDDTLGPTRQGEIVFWGEWEAASAVELVTERVVDGLTGSIDRSTTAYGDALGGGIRQNTDPFVFGDCFLYTYCRQPRNQNLRRLAPGSLILFGSTYKRRFVLDTCFVVGERVPHARHDYSETAVPRVPRVFRETTLDPMYQQMGTSCSLYLGATAEQPAANGMFSFVPRLPAAESRTFARPPIELEWPLIKIGRTMQAGTIPYDDPEQLRELWERVVAQVLGSCALGVRVAIPAPR